MKQVIRISVVVLLLVSLLVPVSPARGEGETGREKCPVCEVEGSAARFVVVGRDGRTTVYACPKCAFMSVDWEKVESARATDFMTRKEVDAKTAWFVFNTSWGACCGPFWLSFGSREDAEMFAKGFGGKVLSFEEAKALFRR